MLGTAQGGLDELSFSPNGKRLAARYDDGAVIVFDVTKGKPLTELRGHDSSQYGKSVAYSPDGSRILTAASDRTVRLWDSETGEQLLVLRYEKNSPSGAVFTPDGKTVLSWIWGGSEPARIWTAR